MDKLFLILLNLQQGKEFLKIEEIKKTNFPIIAPINFPKDYEPQHAAACAPIDSFYFVINDTYGDGVAGSLWGGNDGSVYIEQCGDTIWELPMADFGNQMYDTIYTSGCPPPPPVFPKLLLPDTDCGSSPRRPAIITIFVFFVK